MALDDRDLEGAATSWARAGWISLRRYESLLRWAVGLSVASVVEAIVLHWVPGVPAMLLTAVTVGLAAGAWTGVVRANLGERKKLRVTYERWLLAATTFEAYTGALQACSIAARRFTTDEANDLETALEEASTHLMIPSPLATLLRTVKTDLHEIHTARLRTETAKNVAPVLAASESLAREASRKAAEADAANQRATEILAKAKAHERTAVRALVYAQGQIPMSTYGVESFGSQLPDNLSVPASTDGRVYEANVAGVIPSAPAKWAAGAVPFKITDELLELFDPVGAAQPADTKAREK